MSGDNFHRANVQLADSEEVHLLKQHKNDDLNPHVRIKSSTGKTYNMRADQALNLHRLLGEVVLSPKTSFSNGLLWNGGNISFEIQSLDAFSQGLDLEMTVYNNDASNAVRLTPLYLAIDRIDFISGGNASPFHTLYGLQMYTDYCLEKTDEQFNCESRSVAISPSTFRSNTNAEVGTSSSATYRFSLIGSIFDYKLPLHNIKPITVRIYFNNESGSLYAAPSDPLDVTDLKLHLRIETNPASEAANMRERLMREDHYYRVMDIQNMQISQTLATNTTYTFRMYSISGLVPEFFVYFRTSTGAGSDDNTNFALPNNFELLDETGRSLFNSNSIDVNYLREVIVPKHYPSKFISQIPIIVYPFVEAPWTLRESCFVRGYMTFSDNQIRIESGALNGSYFIDIVAKRYGLLRLTKTGDITLD